MHTGPASFQTTATESSREVTSAPVWFSLAWTPQLCGQYADDKCVALAGLVFDGCIQNLLLHFWARARRERLSFSTGGPSIPGSVQRPGLPKWSVVTSLFVARSSSSTRPGLPARSLGICGPSFVAWYPREPAIPIGVCGSPRPAEQDRDQTFHNWIANAD